MFLRRGYVLALAGVVLQSVGRMVGVRLPAAPRFLHRGTHRGKPEPVEPVEPVEPTHRDAKLMPRLLLPFNQNPENKPSYFPHCLISLSTALSA